MMVVVLATYLLYIAGQAKAVRLDENPHSRTSVSSSMHEENIVELRALDDSIEATILTLADAEDLRHITPAMNELVGEDVQLLREHFKTRAKRRKAVPPWFVPAEI